MKRPRFEVYESDDGWRWRLIAANGRILASGEAHTRKADAERAVATVMGTVKELIFSAFSGNTVCIKEFGQPMLTQKQVAKAKAKAMAMARQCNRASERVS